VAKSIKIKRKELKQPDQFISATDMVFAYYSKHKTRLISVIAAILLVVISGFWIRHNENIKSLRMESLYFKMEQTRTANESNPKEMIKKMENLLKEFSEGPQKQRATLILADQFYSIYEYNRAISLYQDILTETSPRKLHYQLASAGVAYSLEGQKDYKGAIVAYKTIIESHNKYPLFYIYLSLARCYILSNDKNGALLTLREMKTRFSNHPKLGLVESRLTEWET